MKERDFDRMMNPLDVQPGLDELPDFVANDTYLALKASCTNAYEVMNLQRTHRYSVADLKAVIDRYADLAHKADRLMHLYAANDAFVFRYMDLCERYAALEDYRQVAEPLLKEWLGMECYTPVSAFPVWKEAYSAMYENTYFVAEFWEFRNSYECIREASMFLEFDTKKAQKAILEYHQDQVNTTIHSTSWAEKYHELYDRIHDFFGMNFIDYACEEDYNYLYSFKIAKKELKVMLEFASYMADFRHRLLQSHLQF
jgi:hypothetical protein